MKRRACPAALAITLAVAIAACGSADGGRDGAIHLDLSPAKHFEGFTLFYLGPSYRGMQLTGDGREDLRPYHHGSSVNLTYGTCNPTPNSEGRCATPLALVESPICAENTSLYPRSQIGRRITIRGVPAVAFLGTDRKFWRLELYTGRTTVLIDGVGYAQSLDIARRLEPLNHRPFGRTLPAPVAGGVAGKLRRCAASNE